MLAAAVGGCAGPQGWPRLGDAAPTEVPAFAWPVQRPQLRVGDRWVYGGRERGEDAAVGRVVFERTVTRVAGDRVTLRQTPLDPATRRGVGPARDRGVRLSVWHLDPGGRFSGLIRNLEFPLTPGKQWEYEYWLSAPTGDRVTTYRVRARVEGAETIHTPAGRFDTVRVVHDGEWSRPVLEDGQPTVRRGVLSTTYWYSPRVGSWVRLDIELRGPEGEREFGVRQELLEYRRAP